MKEVKIDKHDALVIFVQAVMNIVSMMLLIFFAYVNYDTGVSISMLLVSFNIMMTSSFVYKKIESMFEE